MNLNLIEWTVSFCAQQQATNKALPQRSLRIKYLFDVVTAVDLRLSTMTREKETGDVSK